jgi:hypothetical protein
MSPPFLNLLLIMAQLQFFSPLLATALQILLILFMTRIIQRQESLEEKLVF